METTAFGQYADGLFGPEEPLLATMRDEARELGIPTIQISADLARLLTTLITIRQPRRVLEFGTLFGYSTIVMARSMPTDGHIWTLELSQRHADIARANFQRAGIAELVTVVVGEAARSVDTLDAGPFDFVFIDADKPGYPVYLDAALRLASPGTVIVADNLWRGGDILDPSNDVGAGAAEFNRRIASDPRLATTIVLNRDGADAASISVVR
jgi:predicted O-methyltransferase YrrM